MESGNEKKQTPGTATQTLSEAERCLVNFAFLFYFPGQHLPHRAFATQPSGVVCASIIQVGGASGRNGEVGGA